MLSKNAECGLDWFTFLFTFFKKNNGSHWKQLRESMRLHDESITEMTIPPLQVISDQDKGIKKALEALQTKCDIPIGNFVCSKHVERNLSKYTKVKSRKEMQQGFFCLIFEADQTKLPIIQESLKSHFYEKNKNSKNSTFNLITNTEERVKGLQLYNSTTPRFDIMTSNHCEILNAEMCSFRRFNPTYLIVETLSMQSEKVQIAESMIFLRNVITRQRRRLPKDKEREDDSDRQILTNYGSFLYSTTLITASCLNRQEAGVTIDKSSSTTETKTYKYNVSWDCDISVSKLMEVLRVYFKKIRRRDSFINFRAYAYWQLQFRSAVVIEKKCATVTEEGERKVHSTYSCSHCQKQAYTFVECPHITCVKMRAVLKGHPLIPSMQLLVREVLREDRRKGRYGYCPPILRYNSQLSRANRCILKKTVSASHNSTVKLFSQDQLLGTVSVLKSNNSTTEGVKEMNRKRMTYASNRHKSATEVAKKRGRGRPKKSEKRKNYKRKKLLEETEADKSGTSTSK